MVARKRGRGEMEAPAPAQVPSLLTRLRNMWEFSNIMQYINIFGKAMKVDDDFDIEDLEAECLKTGSHEKLAEIGLCLLKNVSSHRQLTPENFSEYTRRQYEAKAPTRNPFGSEETPLDFADFDIFTKLKILVQISLWTLINADRVREKMAIKDETIWRVDEIGWDRQERSYFVLADNRLYRRTEAPLPPPPAKKPKTKSKAGKAAARASKRRKISDQIDTTDNVDDEIIDESGIDSTGNDDGLGGRKWECIAVTLEEYYEFLESIKKSKHPDEKALYGWLNKEVVPDIEKAEENRQRKLAKRQREMMTLEKLATAKRSSRIASKQEREKEEHEATAAEAKRKSDLLAAKKDAQRQKEMEEARESRMLTREQRLKEREYKRILHEEELANLSEDSKKLETGEARMSERHLKAEIEKKKRELEKLAQDDEWVFDCAKCGVHGENLDDGSHSVACDKCSVWQHSACLGITQAAAEKDDFHFVCDDCTRREEDAKKPKIPTLKFKLGSSSSPPSDKTINVQGLKRKSDASEDGRPRLPPMKKFKHVALPPSGSGSDTNGHGHHPCHINGMRESIMNGPSLSPQGQVPRQGINGTQNRPPPGLASPVHHSTYTNGYLTSDPKPKDRSHHPNGQNSNVSRYTNGYQGYQPSYSPPPTDHTTQLPSPQNTQNPYLNSFDRQRPSSSHSTHNIPSPVKNHPPVSPSQGKSDAALPPFASTTPNKNGGVPPQLSSSPLMAPPAHNVPGQASGLSPSKHSPPRPPSSHGVLGTPMLPPVAQLEPSPQMQNHHPPVKAMTPERLTTHG